MPISNVLRATTKNRKYVVTRWLSQCTPGAGPFVHHTPPESEKEYSCSRSGSSTKIQGSWTFIPRRHEPYEGMELLGNSSVCMMQVGITRQGTLLAVNSRLWKHAQTRINKTRVEHTHSQPKQSEQPSNRLWPYPSCSLCRCNDFPN